MTRSHQPQRTGNMRLEANLKAKLDTNGIVKAHYINLGIVLPPTGHHWGKRLMSPPTGHHRTRPQMMSENTQRKIQRDCKQTRKTCNVVATQGAPQRIFKDCDPMYNLLVAWPCRPPWQLAYWKSKRTSSSARTCGRQCKQGDNAKQRNTII